MADPITNAQFTLGLFQPAVRALAANDERNLAFAYKQAEDKRRDDLMFWKLKMEREDANTERVFRDQQTTKTIAANAASQKEATERIVKQMEATEQRQKEAEVRKLYDEYSELTRDAAEPLEMFGKDVDERFQQLSREVGKLRQKNLLGQGVAKLAEEYGKLGGKGNVADFGSTPSEQIQGLSGAISKLSAEKARNRYLNAAREVSSIGQSILEAEKLSPEEIQQAKAMGVQSMREEARKAFLRFRNTLKNDEAALSAIAKVYPEDVEEYRNKINQAMVGLKMNKRENDKSLRELYESQSQARLRMVMAAERADEIDPDLLLGHRSGGKATPSGSPTGTATLPGVGTAAPSRVVVPPPSKTLSPPKTIRFDPSLLEPERILTSAAQMKNLPTIFTQSPPPQELRPFEVDIPEQLDPNSQLGRRQAILDFLPNMFRNIGTSVQENVYESDNGTLVFDGANSMMPPSPQRTLFGADNPGRQADIDRTAKVIEYLLSGPK